MLVCELPRLGSALRPEVVPVSKDSPGGSAARPSNSTPIRHVQGRDRDKAPANVLDALALMLSPEPVEAGDERERELLHLTLS
jgi:hypothetical protein